MIKVVDKTEYLNIDQYHLDINPSVKCFYEVIFNITQIRMNITPSRVIVYRDVYSILLYYVQQVNIEEYDMKTTTLGSIV